MRKTWTFSDLPSPEIDLELDFYYSHTPASYAAPEEVESEINLPEDWRQRVIDCYTAEAAKAMKVIEDRLMDMNFDNLPRQWWQAERESFLEARAEAACEAMRGY